MDKKATEFYIKKSTGIQVNDLMNALYRRDEYYFMVIETALDR